MAQLAQPQRIERRARRIGFGTPMLREAGMGRYSLEFQLPDKPPKSLARPIASAIIFESPDEGQLAEADTARTVGEITIRFPQAPEHLFDSDTAMAAAETAWRAVGLESTGRIRLNLVVENQHAIHYDIDRGEELPIEVGEFLTKVWDAGERFNRELEDAF